MAEEVKAPIREAEVPWVVAYLREDIQDLRNEIREVRRITIESYEKLDAKLEARTGDLDVKIDALRREMDERFNGLRREMDERFRWTIGIVIGAMLTMTSVFAWIVDRILTP